MSGECYEEKNTFKTRKKLNHIDKTRACTHEFRYQPQTCRQNENMYD